MITDLRLQGFRSYLDASFEFDPGVNIIVGANASGKTNLLEALLVVARGSSFRAKDSELINFSAPWARLDTDSPDRTVKLIRGGGGAIRKEYEISGHKLLRLNLARQLPLVLFEPNHLLLLEGSPERRRDYLDGLLAGLVAGYGQQLRNYKRVLAQRNTLLKHSSAAHQELFAWNVRLSETGGLVAAERSRLLLQISDRLDLTYQSLSGKTTPQVGINYVSDCQLDDYTSSLLRQLEKRQAIDIERGFTTVGPHRDDIAISFDGRPASEVASRGEARTTLLALKIIELRLVEEARGQKPMLLLDDVFSELDGARRKALTEIISGYQTFITTTDADIVVHHFLDSCTVIAIG